MFELKIFYYLAAVICLLAFQNLYYKYLAKKWNCSPIIKVKQDLLGFKQGKILFENRNKGTDLQEARNLFLQYNTDTLSQRIFGRRIFFTCNIDNIKAIVHHQFNDFNIGYRHEAFKPLLGDGIFATEGNIWRHSKEMLRPQFTRDNISNLHHLENHVQNFALKVKENNGTKFDIQELVLKFTLDSSTEFLFGESVNSLVKEEYSMGKYTFETAFNKVQKYIFARTLLQSFYWVYNPNDFKECLEVVHSFTNFFVTKALSLSPKQLEEHSSTNYNFMYELIKVTRDKKLVHDSLINIMLAGRNTTAALISSIILELARNPDIYEKLKKDVAEHFGEGDNVQFDKITIQSMKQCNYLRYVINEGLRLYPSVPQNFRVAKRSITLPKGGGANGEDKIFLKKGQTIFMSFYALQRQEKYYGKDANEFNPDRWENIKNPGAFMPFLAGPRICLGQQYATTEASYLIMRFAQLFSKIELHEDCYPPPISANATMKLRDGVWISVKT